LVGVGVDADREARRFRFGGHLRHRAERKRGGGEGYRRGTWDVMGAV